MNRLLTYFGAIGRAFGPLLGWLEVQANRRRLYTAYLAVWPLLVAGGFLTDGVAQKVLGVLALLAGVGVPGLARKHTPKPRRPPTPRGR